MKKFALVLIAWGSLAPLSTALRVNPQEEILYDGNFGSLDGWALPRIPQGFIRELFPENSPFTEIYPSNNQSLKLGDNADAPAAHVKYLKQNFSNTSRKVTFGVDFKLLPEQTPTGFGISLSSGETPIWNVFIRPDIVLNLHIQGTTTGRWTLPQRGRLDENIWYHLEYIIDMDARSAQGSLRSEMGDVFEIESHDIATNIEDPQAVIDSIQIGSGAGSNSHAAPVLIDNLTLRP